MRSAGRHLAHRIALGTAGLLQVMLAGLLFLPRATVTSALLTTTWLLGAAAIWRWRHAGPVLMAIPFATAAVWYLLLQGLAEVGGAVNTVEAGARPELHEPVPERRFRAGSRGLSRRGHAGTRET